MHITDKEKLRKVFNEIDTDGSGELDTCAAATAAAAAAARVADASSCADALPIGASVLLRALACSLRATSHLSLKGFPATFTHHPHIPHICLTRVCLTSCRRPSCRRPSCCAQGRAAVGARKVQAW